MNDLVERLRCGTNFNDNSITFEAADRIEELEKNINDFVTGNYPHPRSYRPNQCPHDRYYYEECDNCNVAYWKSKGFE